MQIGEEPPAFISGAGLTIVLEQITIYTKSSTMVATTLGPLTRNWRAIVGRFARQHGNSHNGNIIATAGTTLDRGHPLCA